jgi:hypothetical protein
MAAFRWRGPDLHGIDLLLRRVGYLFQHRFDCWSMLKNQVQDFTIPFVLIEVRHDLVDFVLHNLLRYDMPIYVFSETVKKKLHAPCDLGQKLITKLDYAFIGNGLDGTFR